MSGPIRALIVDDEKIICEIIEDILVFEGGGVEATSASSCDEALRLAGEHRFDVVFLDVCMGDGSGLDVLREIKHVRPDARIYMITGYQVEDQLRDALKQGAVGAIHKPFRVKEILSALRGDGSEGASLSD